MTRVRPGWLARQMLFAPDVFKRAVVDAKDLRATHTWVGEDVADSGASVTVTTKVHRAKDGVVTILSMKVEPAGPCNLGIGCDEYGVCYADAHGEPERCGRPA